jgi:endonuclease YncB( thermonuclease family)
MQALAAPMPRFLLFLLALLSVPAAGAPFEARVVRVKDGDSVVVERVREKRESELRLSGIDAPELGQPWGPSARAALRRLVEGRVVMVEVVDRDRYGRLVSNLWVGRAYVNAAMTRSGNAWAVRRYGADRETLAGHDAARAAGLGLWSLPPEQRVPPATWRQRHPRGER